jgi:tRNA 2-thiouridine synthesizing protein A
MTVTVDCRGLVCPMPIIQVRKALNTLHKNDTVTIYADDTSFELDFLRFCYLADLELLTKTTHHDYQSFYVKILK